MPIFAKIDVAAAHTAERRANSFHIAALLSAYLPQQCLYFLPEPQGHGSFLPTLGAVRTTWTFSGLLLEPIAELL